MGSYDILWFVAAFGGFHFILYFLAHRSRRPPRMPLRVPRIVAALAGSRTSYVELRSFAIQVAAASMPVWHYFLNLRPGIEVRGIASANDPVLIGVGTGIFAYCLFVYVAKRRLKSAEYVLLNGRFAFWEVGDFTAEAKTVCRHCGYLEPVWNFREMRLELELEKPSVGFAYSVRDDFTLIVPSGIAVALRNAMVTGCVLQPVGGDEPAKWYGLSSDHVLPPAVVAIGDRREMPYRTPRCEENHGIELKTGRKDWEIHFRRSTFHALDVSSSYELLGPERRRGGRLLVVSQKVFRLLLGFDKDLLWWCQPVIFVD